MKNYKIAELVIKMSPQYTPLLPQSTAYEYSGSEPPVANLCMTERGYEYYEKMYPEASRDLIEYMATGTGFYSELIKHSGLLLHASAVEIDGYAYLFSAQSGTGKSTHTSFWVKEFYPRARIINDDKPAIRILPDGIYVYGTPWSGKTDQNRNVKVPLGGIAFISRSKINKITKAPQPFAIRSFLEQTVRFKDESRTTELLDLIGKILEEVPVFHLECNMDPEAAHIAYAAMRKGVL